MASQERKNLLEYNDIDVKYHYIERFSEAKVCGSAGLYQVGEMFCDGQKRVPEHTQPCFEITFIVEGKGYVYANKKQFDVNAGDCFISIEGELHEIVSSKDYPLRFKFIAFIPVGEQTNNCHKYVDIISSYVKERRIINLPALNDRFLKIFDEFQNETVFSGEAIGLETEGLLIDVIRALQSFGAKKYPTKITEESVLVFKVVRAIDNNISKMKNLYELEDILGYSYNHISAVFKKVIGYSINEYFIKSKMEYAKKQLTETDLSITDVAEMLNYSSIHTFTRSFKNYFGYSPSELKNKNNK